MNKKTYLGLVLVACLGFVSTPLWAEAQPAATPTTTTEAIKPAPEHPANIKAPAASPEEHSTAAALHKEHAAHHKAMAEHHKSIAAEYGKVGHKHLKKHHEELAKHHEALAKEHEKTAETHESVAKSKNNP